MPGLGLKIAHQLFPLPAARNVLRQTQKNRVSRIDAGTRHGKKPSEKLRHTVQKPTCTDIGHHTNADFRHRKTRRFGGNPMAAPHHQTGAAAHDIAITPAYYRFWVSMNRIVENVLIPEKSLQILRGPDRPAGFRDVTIKRL